MAFTALGLMPALTPARALGDNVVMVAVVHVEVPQKLPGICQVGGTIAHVWEGTAFQKGQTILLHVPCGDHRGGPLPPATQTQGARLTDPTVLRLSKLGAAHIDDAGNLLWQPAGSSRDVIWGYRVLEAVGLRLNSAIF